MVNKVLCVKGASMECNTGGHGLAARTLFLPRDASAERGNEIACRLSVCLSVRNVQVPCSNRLEFFENNFTAK